VLFADLASFTERTVDLTPTETLFFVNNFFAWVSAEALRGRPAIVDKYMGDALMVVFSTEFGSEEPFVDAVQAARWMAENDALSFAPQMGLASGRVVVGHVGTPLKYDCSVFGSPVALAARCTAVEPDEVSEPYSSAITFPVAEWGGRDFDVVFPPRRYRMPDGAIDSQPHPWEMLPSRRVSMKGIGEVEVLEIVNRSVHLPSQSAEDRAREGLADLRKAELEQARAVAGRSGPHVG